MECGKSRGQSHGIRGNAYALQDAGYVLLFSDYGSSGKN